MIHRLGVPRAAVDVEQVQPLPWEADEVFVSFSGGPAYTCRVSRYPGDVVRVKLVGLRIPPGTPVEIQWTQQQRGSYASGAVVGAGAGEPPGVYVRIDESVSGIERRLGVRVDARVPIVLSDRSGGLLRGHTLDLSEGGAHAIVDAGGTDSPAPFGPGDRIAAELTLGGKAVRSTCLVSGIGAEPGDVRLRFLDPDSVAVDRIEAFLGEARRNRTA